MVGQCRFGRQLPLRPDAGVDFSLRPAVFALQPLALHFRAGGHHDHRIDQLLRPDFQQQRHLQHHRRNLPRPAQPVHVLLHRLEHLGMDHPLELLPPLRVREDHRGQPAPVDRLVVIQDVAAEGLHDPPPGQPLGLHRLVRHGIGVEDHRPQLLEHLRDGALARPEAAGEPDHHHDARPVTAASAPASSGPLSASRPAAPPATWRLP